MHFINVASGLERENQQCADILLKLRGTKVPLNINNLITIFSEILEQLPYMLIGIGANTARCNTY